MASDKDSELLGALVGAAEKLLERPKDSVDVEGADDLVRADLWRASRIDDHAARQTAIKILQRVSDHHHPFRSL